MYCMPVIKTAKDRAALQGREAGKNPWTVKVEGPGEKALVYRGGDVIEWKVAAS
jgi:hypothetical protein